jgi:5'-3' exoribonuclease 2
LCFDYTAEERQDQNAKRRKLEIQSAKNGSSMGPSPTVLTTPAAPTNHPVHPSLPQRPAYNFAANADSMGLGAPPTSESIQNMPVAVQALAGSNRDVVANRRAIRMANMSAGEVLKAELFGLSPTKPDLSLPPKPSTPDINLLPTPTSTLEATKMSVDAHNPNEISGVEPHFSSETVGTESDRIDEDFNAGEVSDLDAIEVASIGTKRKLHDIDEGQDDLPLEDDDVPTSSLAMKVNPDGTVEQEDIVKCATSLLFYLQLTVYARLWEPGYKERYYRQKFGVELSDTKFRKEFVGCLYLRENVYLINSSQLNEKLH